MERRPICLLQKGRRGENIRTVDTQKREASRKAFYMDDIKKNECNAERGLPRENEKRDSWEGNLQGTTNRSHAQERGGRRTGKQELFQEGLKTDNKKVRG